MSHAPITLIDDNPGDARIPCDPGAHSVSFYDTDEALLQALVEHFAAGLRAGENCVIFATKPHRVEVAKRLASHPDSRPANGARLIAFDAAAALAQFMIHTTPDPVLYDQVIGGMVRQLRTEGQPLRAYGEMVALLWAEGNIIGALELEDMWSGLQRTEMFALHCEYPNSVITESDTDDLGIKYLDAARARICRHHNEHVALAAGRA